MSMRESTVMKKNKEMYQIRNELVICEPLCTSLLTRFRKEFMMCSLYDKINVKRIQARFKKYIHAKKCVDMNFLHFVGV